MSGDTQVQQSAAVSDANGVSGTDAPAAECETLSKRQRKRLAKAQQWEEQRELRK